MGFGKCHLFFGCGIMKFFIISLFLLLLFDSPQGSTLSRRRPVRGLNTTLQTSFNGTYERRNPCNNEQIETSSYTASHEYHHHSRENNWKDYSSKCAAIISSFIQAIGKLVRFNNTENGKFNFHINTSISQKQVGECKKNKSCIPPTIIIQGTDCDLPPKSSSEKLCSKAVSPCKSLRMQSYSLTGHSSEEANKTEDEACPWDTDNKKLTTTACEETTTLKSQESKPTTFEYHPEITSTSSEDSPTYYQTSEGEQTSTETENFKTPYDITSIGTSQFPRTGTAATEASSPAVFHDIPKTDFYVTTTTGSGPEDEFTTTSLPNKYEPSPTDSTLGLGTETVSPTVSSEEESSALTSFSPIHNENITTEFHATGIPEWHYSPDYTSPYTDDETTGATPTNFSEEPTRSIPDSEKHFSSITHFDQFPSTSTSQPLADNSETTAYPLPSVSPYEDITTELHPTGTSEWQSSKDYSGPLTGGETTESPTPEFSSEPIPSSPSDTDSPFSTLTPFTQFPTSASPEQESTDIYDSTEGTTLEGETPLTQFPTALPSESETHFDSDNDKTTEYSYEPSPSTFSDSESLFSTKTFDHFPSTHSSHADNSESTESPVASVRPYENENITTKFHETETPEWQFSLDHSSPYDETIGSTPSDFSGESVSTTLSDHDSPFSTITPLSQPSSNVFPKEETVGHDTTESPLPSVSPNDTENITIELHTTGAPELHASLDYTSSYTNDDTTEAPTSDLPGELKLSTSSDSKKHFSSTTHFDQFSSTSSSQPTTVISEPTESPHTSIPTFEKENIMTEFHATGTPEWHSSTSNTNPYTNDDTTGSIPPDVSDEPIRSTPSDTSEGGGTSNPPFGQSPSSASPDKHLTEPYNTIKPKPSPGTTLEEETMTTKFQTTLRPESQTPFENDGTTGVTDSVFYQHQTPGGTMQPESHVTDKPPFDPYPPTLSSEQLTGNYETSVPGPSSGDIPYKETTPNVSPDYQSTLKFVRDTSTSPSDFYDEPTPGTFADTETQFPSSTPSTALPSNEHPIENYETSVSPPSSSTTYSEGTTRPEFQKSVETDSHPSQENRTTTESPTSDFSEEPEPRTPSDNKTQFSSITPHEHSSSTPNSLSPTDNYEKTESPLTSFPPFNNENITTEFQATGIPQWQSSPGYSSPSDEIATPTPSDLPDEPTPSNPSDTDSPFSTLTPFTQFSSSTSKEPQSSLGTTLEEETMKTKFQTTLHPESQTPFKNGGTTGVTDSVFYHHETPSGTMQPESHVTDKPPVDRNPSSAPEHGSTHNYDTTEHQRSPGTTLEGEPPLTHFSITLPSESETPFHYHNDTTTAYSDEPIPSTFSDTKSTFSTVPPFHDSSSTPTSQSPTDNSETTESPLPSISTYENITTEFHPIGTPEWQSSPNYSSPYDERIRSTPSDFATESIPSSPSDTNSSLSTLSPFTQFPISATPDQRSTDNYDTTEQQRFPGTTSEGQTPLIHFPATLPSESETLFDYHNVTIRHSSSTPSSQSPTDNSETTESPLTSFPQFDNEKITTDFQATGTPEWQSSPGYSSPHDERTGSTPADFAHESIPSSPSDTDSSCSSLSPFSLSPSSTSPEQEWTENYKTPEPQRSPGTTLENETMTTKFHTTLPPESETPFENDITTGVTDSVFYHHETPSGTMQPESHVTEKHPFDHYTSTLSLEEETMGHETEFPLTSFSPYENENITTEFHATGTPERHSTTDLISQYPSNGTTESPISDFKSEQTRGTVAHTESPVSSSTPLYEFWSTLTPEEEATGTYDTTESQLPSATILREELTQFPTTPEPETPFYYSNDTTTELPDFGNSDKPTASTSGNAEFSTITPSDQFSTPSSQPPSFNYKTTQPQPSSEPAYEEKTTVTEFPTTLPPESETPFDYRKDTTTICSDKPTQSTFSVTESPFSTVTAFDQFPSVSSSQSPRDNSESTETPLPSLSSYENIMTEFHPTGTPEWQSSPYHTSSYTNEATESPNSDLSEEPTPSTFSDTESPFSNITSLHQFSSTPSSKPPINNSGTSESPLTSINPYDNENITTEVHATGTPEWQSSLDHSSPYDEKTGSTPSDLGHESLPSSPSDTDSSFSTLSPFSQFPTSATLKQGSTDSYDTTEPLSSPGTTLESETYLTQLSTTVPPTPESTLDYGNYTTTEYSYEPTPTTFSVTESPFSTQTPYDHFPSTPFSQSPTDNFETTESLPTSVRPYENENITTEFHANGTREWQSSPDYSKPFTDDEITESTSSDFSDEPTSSTFSDTGSLSSTLTPLHQFSSIPSSKPPINNSETTESSFTSVPKSANEITTMEFHATGTPEWQSSSDYTSPYTDVDTTESSTSGFLNEQTRTTFSEGDSQTTVRNSSNFPESSSPSHYSTSSSPDTEPEVLVSTPDSFSSGGNDSPSHHHKSCNLPPGPKPSSTQSNPNFDYGTETPFYDSTPTFDVCNTGPSTTKESFGNDQTHVTSSTPGPHTSVGYEDGSGSSKRPPSSDFEGESPYPIEVVNDSNMTTARPTSELSSEQTSPIISSPTTQSPIDIYTSDSPSSANPTGGDYQDPLFSEMENQFTTEQPYFPTDRSPVTSSTGWSVSDTFSTTEPPTSESYMPHDDEPASSTSNPFVDETSQGTTPKYSDEVTSEDYKTELPYSEETSDSTSYYGFASTTSPSQEPSSAETIVTSTDSTGQTEKQTEDTFTFGSRTISPTSETTFEESESTAPYHSTKAPKDSTNYAEGLFTKPVTSKPTPYTTPLPETDYPELLSSTPDTTFTPDPESEISQTQQSTEQPSIDTQTEQDITTLLQQPSTVYPLNHQTDGDVVPFTTYRPSFAPENQTTASEPSHLGTTIFPSETEPTVSPHYSTGYQSTTVPSVTPEDLYYSTQMSTFTSRGDSVTYPPVGQESPKALFNETEPSTESFVTAQSTSAQTISDPSTTPTDAYVSYSQTHTNPELESQSLISTVGNDQPPPGKFQSSYIPNSETTSPYSNNPSMDSKSSSTDGEPMDARLKTTTTWGTARTQPENNSTAYDSSSVATEYYSTTYSSSSTTPAYESETDQEPLTTLDDSHPPQPTSDYHDQFSSVSPQFRPSTYDEDSVVTTDYPFTSTKPPTNDYSDVSISENESSSTFDPGYTTEPQSSTSTIPPTEYLTPSGIPFDYSERTPYTEEEPTSSTFRTDSSSFVDKMTPSSEGMPMYSPSPASEPQPQPSSDCRTEIPDYQTTGIPNQTPGTYDNTSAFELNPEGFTTSSPNASTTQSERLTTYPYTIAEEDSDENFTVSTTVDHPEWSSQSDSGIVSTTPNMGIGTDVSSYETSTPSIPPEPYETHPTKGTSGRIDNFSPQPTTAVTFDGEITTEYPTSPAPQPQPQTIMKSVDPLSDDNISNAPDHTVTISSAEFKSTPAMTHDPFSQSTTQTSSSEISTQPQSATFSETSTKTQYTSSPTEQTSYSDFTTAVYPLPQTSQRQPSLSSQPTESSVATDQSPEPTQTTPAFYSPFSSTVSPQGSSDHLDLETVATSHTLNEGESSTMFSEQPTDYFKTSEGVSSTTAQVDVSQTMSTIGYSDKPYSGAGSSEPDQYQSTPPFAWNTSELPSVKPPQVHTSETPTSSTPVFDLQTEHSVTSPPTEEISTTEFPTTVTDSSTDGQPLNNTDYDELMTTPELATTSAPCGPTDKESTPRSNPFSICNVRKRPEGGTLFGPKTSPMYFENTSDEVEDSSDHSSPLSPNCATETLEEEQNPTSPSTSADYDQDLSTQSPHFTETMPNLDTENTVPTDREPQDEEQPTSSATESPPGFDFEVGTTRHPMKSPTYPLPTEPSDPLFRTVESNLFSPFYVTPTPDGTSAFSEGPSSTSHIPEETSFEKNQNVISTTAPYFGETHSNFVPSQSTQPNAGMSTTQDATISPQPVSDLTTPSNEPGEDCFSRCKQHGKQEPPLLCPFDPVLKGNMTAPSYYILISKLPVGDDNDERFQVEKVYLGDGTPLNCSVNSGKTFPTSLYTSIPLKSAGTETPGREIFIRITPPHL